MFGIKAKRGTASSFLSSEQTTNIKTKEQLEEIANTFKTEEQLLKTAYTFETSLKKLIPGERYALGFNPMAGDKILFKLHHIGHWYSGYNSNLSWIGDLKDTGRDICDLEVSRSEGPIICSYDRLTMVKKIRRKNFSPPVQHNASPDDNSRTIVTVSFRDITGMKPCPDLSPNQLELRIAFSTETTRIRKEDTTPLMRCPVFVLLTPL
ncbi:uncharacterized protein TNCV_2504391 [Trichonephila clavipes]|uniref:Uncharacterized protein n=1 Tax=Trichonephila clavipes TaxID=2585209 RepID=A0A8X6WHS0_TRICX|nr:uncharacterized protein TNCV_2504391 [Trichonephila clavipes]